MGKLRVAIVGVGNCASSLVQGARYYRDVADDEHVPGLMHTTLGGYRIRDIEFSLAVDVSRNKVGRDLGEAIFAEPNNTLRFSEVPPLGVRVARGPTMDGLGSQLAEVVEESRESALDAERFTSLLRETGTDVVVSYLPVGAEEATRWYAKCALEAGCALVNCIPVFIASDNSWRERFAKRCVPLIGDDVKSQFGATIVHRVLANLLRERGVRLDRTYQLNVGGNADFMNMLERERLKSKKVSKTRAVSSQLSTPLPESCLHIGPSDYIPWLEDRKVCFIRCEGTTFGDVPLSLELKMEVWDSPNSAGVVIDAVRCAKLALDHGVGGALTGPCAWFMKSPPEQLTDHDALERTEAFIRELSSDPIRLRPASNGQRQRAKVASRPRSPRSGVT